MRLLLSQHAFLIALALAMLAALVVPVPMDAGVEVFMRWGVQVGIWAIFLMQGFSLPTEALWRGLLRWRLHLFIQSWIFLGVPLLAVVLTGLAGGWLQPEVRAGLFFLAILPTTVSSAVAFTATAGGDTAAAVFNTALANLLGVLLVPLWCFWMLGGALTTGRSLEGLFVDLALLILLPMLCGQLLRIFLKEALLPRVKSVAKPLSNAIIVFMVYVAFARSVSGGAWDGAPVQLVFQAGVAALLLLVGVHALVWWSGAWMPPRERVTAWFCGSQKTLAAGIPLAQALLGGQAGSAALAWLLLPLMLYHPAQLLLSGLLMPRLQRFIAAAGSPAG